MDIKKIQDLIKLVNKTNIAELSIEDQDGKITIKQKDSISDHYLQPNQFNPFYSIPPQNQIQKNQQSSGDVKEEKINNEISNHIVIKSPMIGTFYSRPSPDKPNFVEVGEPIEIGKVICILEAMKLFNEIESEVSGTIVKVLVENSSPVEFDQPLFIVSPK